MCVISGTFCHVPLCSILQTHLKTHYFPHPISQMCDICSPPPLPLLAPLRFQEIVILHLGGKLDRRRPPPLVREVEGLLAECEISHIGEGCVSTVL